MGKLERRSGGGKGDRGMSMGMWGRPWAKYFFGAEIHRKKLFQINSESPIWVGRRGSPRFAPICSDFPVFFRFVPICVPCLREYPDLFRFVLICSVFFRFVPICFQNKSGKPLSADPFCKSPINLTLSGTGDSQRDSHESIRANHSQLKPLFL